MASGTVVFEPTRIVGAPRTRHLSRERPELLLEASPRSEPPDVGGFRDESLVRTVDDDKSAALLSQFKIECRESAAHVVPIGTVATKSLSQGRRRLTDPFRERPIARPRSTIAGASLHVRRGIDAVANVVLPLGARDQRSTILAISHFIPPAVSLRPLAQLDLAHRSIERVVRLREMSSPISLGMHAIDGDVEMVVASFLAVNSHNMLIRIETEGR